MAELTMNGRINEISAMIDRTTSRTICDAVGERLQQSLRPEALQPSSYLQHLMDELRRRDQENLPPN
jgi:hypothetical protein